MRAKLKTINGDMMMLLFTVWMMAHAFVIIPLVTPALPEFLVRNYTKLIILFLPFILYLLVSRQKPTDVLKLKLPKLKHILLSVVIGVALVPFVALSAMLVPLLSDLIFPAVEVPATAGDAGISLGNVLLTSAVFAALFEEILFRGVFYNQYEKQGVPVFKIIIATSLVFALIHGNLVQIIYAFPFGILLAYLLYYSRSIWVPIVAHFVTNAVGFTMFYMMTAAEYAYEAVETAAASNDLLWGILIFVIVCLIMMPIIILCVKSFQKYHAEASEAAQSDVKTGDSAKPNVFTWAFWVLVVIWVAFTLLISFGVI